MLDNEFDYEVIIDDMEELCDVFKSLPEKNIAFAFTGRPFPFVVHVLRQGGRATVREMSYDVLPIPPTGGDGEAGKAD